MITVTYKDLKKMDACHVGKRRFAKRGWFKTVFLNRPVSLYDIARDGHNTNSDFWWLVDKMQTRLTPDDYKMIAAGIKEILIKHKKCDVTAGGYSKNLDIHYLNKVIRHVLENNAVQWVHRRVLFCIPLTYSTGYYGYGNDDLHQDIRDFLINLDTTVDWSNELYGLHCKWR